MNGLVGLAGEFFEHVAAPAHGADVNDGYGERFDRLLAGDTEFASVLGWLELRPDDVPSLTIDAWLWYLRWRGERHPPPSTDFLDALFEATDEPAVHARIIEVVVRSPEPFEQLASAPFDRLPPLAELPMPWLRERLQRALSPGKSESRSGDVEAQVIATYLLQLGDPASVRVLRVLLAEPLAREAGLDEHMLSLLGGLDLDDETFDAVVTELGIEV